MGRFGIDLSFDYGNLKLKNLLEDANKSKTANLSSQQNSISSNFGANTTSNFNGSNGNNVETMDLTLNIEKNNNNININENNAKFNNSVSNNQANNSLNNNINNNKINNSSTNSTFNNANINNNSQNNSGVNINSSNSGTSTISNINNSNSSNINSPNNSTAENNGVNLKPDKMDKTYNDNKNTVEISQNSNSTNSSNTMNTSNLSNNKANNNGKTAYQQDEQSDISIDVDIQNDSTSNSNFVVKDGKVVVTTTDQTGKKVEVEIEIDEYINNLKLFGFNEKDINRIINGKISPEELIKEIQNDPDNTRRKQMMESSYLQSCNTEFTTMDELYDALTKNKTKLEELLQKKNELNNNHIENTRELDEQIKELQEKQGYYEYIYDYINTEVDYYFENIEKYTLKDDFLSNVYSNASCIDTLNKIKEKYANRPITNNIHIDDVKKVFINDKDELVDVLSCMINGEGDISEGYIKINNNIFKLESSDDMLDHYVKWLPFMSETEKEIFNYKYNTEGKEAAYNYLNDISEELDTRWLANQTKEDQEFAEEHPFLASIASIAVTPVEGMSAIAYSLNSYITGEKIKRTDVYSSGDVWRGQVSQIIALEHGEGWAFVYNTGMSMADTGSLILLNMATGGTASVVLSATLMGSRAYVSTLNDALDRGISDGKAIILAASAGIVETAMESASLGHLMKLEEKLGKNVIDKVGQLANCIENEAVSKIVTKSFYIGASAISQGICEGEEEVATEIANYVIDIFVSKDLSNYSKTIESYLNSGYSEDEALLKTMSDFRGQAFQAFLGGFVSGICFGGFGGVTSTNRTSYAIANEMYTELGGDTFAQKFAEALKINQEQISNYGKAAKAMKNNEQLTNEQLDLLSNGTTEMQAKAKIKEARKEQINKINNEIQNISQGILNASTATSMLSLKKIVQGSTLTANVRATINKSKTENLSTNIPLLEKCSKEGLIHITSEASAEKILESGYVKASGNVITSYGTTPKAFFFSGIPDFGAVCMNVDYKDEILGVEIKHAEYKEKIVGVRIKPTIDSLSDSTFKYRNQDDFSITHDGNYVFDKSTAELVYLVLDINEEGNFYYKEATKEEYENYVPNINSISKNAPKSIKKLCDSIKGYLFGISYQYDILANKVNSINKLKASEIEEISSKIPDYQELKINSRIDTSNIVELDSDTIDGTSVINYVINKLNNRKGYLKETGCMLGIEHEDLNELISTKILKKLGFNAADIDLVTLDNNSDGWISYDLLEENEVAIDIGFQLSDIDNLTNSEKLDKFIENIDSSLLRLNLDTNEQQRLKKEIIEVLFMNALLDNYDFKSDNVKISYNTVNNSYGHVMCYDYGIALNKQAHQKKCIFEYLSSEEIIEYLIKNYSNYLNEISEKVQQQITLEYLENLLNSSTEFEKIDKEMIIKQIQENINLINKLDDSKIKEIIYESSEQLDNSSILELVNEIPTDLQEFADLVTKVRNYTDKTVPNGYDSAFNYKKDFVKTLIDSGKLDNLDNRYIAQLAMDPIMLTELIGTEKLNNLYVKNLDYLPNLLVPALSKLNSKDFNNLFDNPTIQNYLNSLDAKTIGGILKKFELNEQDNLNWISNDTIINKIINMDNSEFYSFIKEIGYYSNSIQKHIQLGNNTAGYLKLLDAIKTKFYTTEFILNNISYKNALDYILITYTRDVEVDLKVNEIKSIIKQIEDKIIDSLRSSSQIELQTKGTSSNIKIKVNPQFKYYNLVFEVNGNIETKEYKAYSDNIDITNLINKDYYAQAALNGNLKLKEINVDMKKSNLVLTDKIGLKKGLNEVILDLDGIKQKILVYSKGSDVDLNYTYGEKFQNTKDIKVKSIAGLDSMNFEVDDTKALYAISYEIDGTKHEKYIRTEKPSFNSKISENTLNIDKFIGENNLIGIKNIKIRKVTDLQIKEEFPLINAYKASSDIYTSSSYGGNQSDIVNLISNALNGKNLSNIDTQKVRVLNKLLDKHFSNLTDIQRINIATHYAKGGCAWMAVSNAFATYMGSINNGINIFKQKFGFDLTISNDYHNFYNLEAIAFDMYLSYFSDKYNGNAEELLKSKTASGISAVEFELKIAQYFVNHGINIEYDTSVTTATKSELRNELLQRILNNKTGFNILSASNFDIKQIDQNIENKKSFDQALANSKTDDNIKRGVGGHAMLVTGIDEDMNLIVSSWSKKYQFMIDSISEYSDLGQFSSASIWTINFSIPENGNDANSSSIIGQDKQTYDAIDYHDTITQLLRDSTNIKSIVQPIKNVIMTMDIKYGNGIYWLEKYLMTGDKTLITKDNNCRSYIESLNKNDLTKALNIIINESNIHQKFTIPNNLTPQEAMNYYNSLVHYIQKGNIGYSYYDYLNYVNDCKKNAFEYFFNYKYLNLFNQLEQLKVQFSYSKKYFSLKTKNDIFKYFGNINDSFYSQVINAISGISSLSSSPIIGYDLEKIKNINYLEWLFAKPSKNIVNYLNSISYSGKKINWYDKKGIINYMQQTPQGKFLTTLTVGEVLAIYEYTVGSGTILQYLTGIPISNHFRIKDKIVLDNIIRGLDSAINKYGGLNDNMILYRGDNFKKLSLWKHWNVKNFNDLQSYVGQTIICDTYMSTGVSKAGSFSGEVNWIIKAPIGTKGMYINDLSHYYSNDIEFEYIVKRASKFRIDKVYQKGGITYIEAKIVE